jgi:hypothetical protein
MELKLPFEADNDLDLQKAICERSYPSFSEHYSSVIKSVIDRMMIKV